MNEHPIDTGIKFYDKNPTGAEDFYIDIPGCGNQRFTKSVYQLNIGVCNQKTVNISSQRHQTTETSEAPWDYIFLPKSKNWSCPDLKSNFASQLVRKLRTKFLGTVMKFSKNKQISRLSRWQWLGTLKVTPRQVAPKCLEPSSSWQRKPTWPSTSSYITDTPNGRQATLERGLLWAALPCPPASANLSAPFLETKAL